MNNINDQKLEELLEMVRFIKDHAATQESVEKLGFKVSNLESKVDQGFTDIIMELRAIHGELDDIRQELKKLELRTREDADSASDVYVKFQRRLEILEKRVQHLELAH